VEGCGTKYGGDVGVTYRRWWGWNYEDCLQML